MPIPYEYSDIELDDGEDVIAWLAEQAWSTGKVGMFGISWGGFNSIQMALRNPSALKAFVAVMATDYLYAEDVHYIDGIMHTDSWMMSHDLYNVLPGAPDFVMDEDWVKNRFEAKPSVYAYMHEQRDGSFWDRASARGQYEKLRIPGYHIGGWFDGYRNSLPRMLEHADAPVKAMIGPWDHYFPHDAWPEPRVEWRREAVRWFDHWLKGEDTGILEEPAFAVYVRDWYAPDPAIETCRAAGAGKRAGPSRERNTRPGSRRRPRPRHRSGRRGHASPRVPGFVRARGRRPDDVVGQRHARPAADGRRQPRLRQRAARVSVGNSRPARREAHGLGERAARQLGGPHLRRIARGPGDAGRRRRVQRHAPKLRARARRPRAGRDVPDRGGAALHVLGVPERPPHTRGGQQFAVADAVADADPVETTLAIGGENGARIVLPVIPPGEARAPDFAQPKPDPEIEGYETLDAGNITGYAAITEIERDPETGEAFGTARNSGATRYPWGIERFEEEIEHRTSDTNPAETSVTGRYRLTEELEGRTLEFEQTVEFTSDEQNFRLKFHRWVDVDGERFREKTWDEVIPRDFQ